MSKIPNLWENKNECCGCGACRAVCPKGAIEMQLDNKGFLYPHIDEAKCEECILCTKTCPIRKPVVE